MPDDTRPLKEAGSSASLARIADALGLPTSYFYMAAGGDLEASERIKLEGPVMLALVRSYLQSVPPGARHDFAEAVKVLADDPSS